MGKVPKHCSNVHYINFIRFIDHCQVNGVGKSLSFWHEKAWDCLLTHWLLMKCILFLIETILRYQFRCNYLRKKKFFLSFLLHLWNLDEKDDPHRFRIIEVPVCENVLRSMAKGCRFRERFDKPYGKGS